MGWAEKRGAGGALNLSPKTINGYDYSTNNDCVCKLARPQNMLNTLSTALSSLKPESASKPAARSAACFFISKSQYYFKTLIEFQSSVCVCEERKHFSQDLLHVCYCVGCFDSAA